MCGGRKHYSQIYIFQGLKLEHHCGQNHLCRGFDFMVHDMVHDMVHVVVGFFSNADHNTSIKPLMDGSNQNGILYICTDILGHT